MSKADRCVVRNTAYRAGSLEKVERHNERKNEHYHNSDIHKERAQLREQEYESSKRQLTLRGRQVPMEASYSLDIRVNDTLYCLRVYFISRFRIVATQAVRTDMFDHQCELISKSVLFGALTKIALKEYATRQLDLPK